MVKIYNTIDKVNGDPQQLSILVELIWDKVSSPVATHIGEEKTCDGPVRLACNPVGYWETEIQPNDAVAPDSFYRITHFRDDGTENHVKYYIYVESDEPEVWTGSLLTTPPEWFAGHENEWVS